MHELRGVTIHETRWRCKAKSAGSRPPKKRSHSRSIIVARHFRHHGPHMLAGWQPTLLMFLGKNQNNILHLFWLSSQGQSKGQRFQRLWV
jgi:hypothetical protein